MYELYMSVFVRVWGRGCVCESGESKWKFLIKDAFRPRKAYIFSLASSKNYAKMLSKFTCVL